MFGSHGPAFDHACASQDVEVMKEGCLGQFQAEGVAGAFALGGESDDVQPHGIAQGVEHHG